MVGTVSSQSSAACIAVAVGTVVVLVLLLGWDGRLTPGATWTLVPAKHYGNSTTAFATSRDTSPRSSALLELLRRARSDRNSPLPGDSTGAGYADSGGGGVTSAVNSSAEMNSSTPSRSLYAGLMRGRSSSRSSSAGSRGSSGSSSSGGNTTVLGLPPTEGLHVRGVKALAGIYAGLLRGGSVLASNGGSDHVSSDKAGPPGPTDASVSLPAAAEGSGRIVVRIPEDIDAQFAGKGCAAGCEKWGACDRELGVCRCPWGRRGPACAELALPACRLRDANDAWMRCPFDGVTWPRGYVPQVSCECHRQCAAHLEALGQQAVDLPPLLNASEVRCFEWEGLPAALQLSAFPAPGEKRVLYFRGSIAEAQTVTTRDDVASGWKYWGNLTKASNHNQELRPLQDCPGSCSYTGACMLWHDAPRGWYEDTDAYVAPAPETAADLASKNASSPQADDALAQRPSNATAPSEYPQCICFPGLAGEDCGARYGLGTAYDACPGGCSGRGECVMGFCRCTGGYFGADCSRSKVYSGPQLRPADRLRIFIYELPHELVQAHVAERNSGFPIYIAYRLFLHALRSDWSIRTENPFEANLFLVPAQMFSFADNLGFNHRHAARAVDWVRMTWPFYNASGGGDHLLWWSGDQGYAKTIPYPPDPYGEDYRRLQAPVKMTHFCYSGPGAGNGTDLRARYGENWYGPGWAPGELFRPSRDVCAMPFSATDVREETLHTYANVTDTPAARAELGRLPLGSRTTLLYFLGSIPKMWRVNGTLVTSNAQYSAGARQALAALHSDTPGFRVAYKRRAAPLQPPLRSNGEEMRDATFCFCPSGFGFGMRIMEAVAYGCIPVIVQDDVQSFLESVLPYERFSLRLPKCEIPQLDSILRSISAPELARLQWGLVDYHRAFVWEGGWGREYPGEPYGLAYNWTIAALEKSLASVRAEGRLQEATTLRAWWHRQSAAPSTTGSRRQLRWLP